MNGNLSKSKGVSFEYDNLTDAQKSEFLKTALPEVKEYADIARNSAEGAVAAREGSQKSAEEAAESARLADESKKGILGSLEATQKAQEGAVEAKAAAENAKAAAEKSAADAENARKELGSAVSNATKSAGSAEKSREAAAEASAKSHDAAGRAAQSEQKAKESENKVAQDKSDTEQFTRRAETAAENAEESEVKSSASQKSAEQALADLLRMINSGDLVLAINGKLPLSAIPATATQEIYVVESEDELTSLTAQRGDLAELVEEIDGERTITKTWQCLGDASVRENWVVWGTSYAVQSGNATTADNAVNANMINNHRLVEMTEEDFASAVKDADTYYLVY